MRDFRAARIQNAIGREEPEPGTYAKAREVLFGFKDHARDDCYRGAVRYLCKAEMTGAEVPDYITATEEGTVWMEWVNGDRRHVEIMGDDHGEMWNSRERTLSGFRIEFFPAESDTGLTDAGIDAYATVDDAQDAEAMAPPLTYPQAVARIAASFGLFILAMAAVVAVVKLGGG